jgi:hypothetical protein
MKPTAPVGSGQGDDRPVRPVHHYRVVLGPTLLAERVAVVPDCTGVGRMVGGGHG